MRFGEEVAAGYDADTADRFDPAVLGPTVDLLAELAGPGGRALELGVGTGRVALPLAGRGVAVHGIDESQPMLDVLAAKPGGHAVRVVCGDMTATSVGSDFDLVFVVYNTITNLVSQDDQVVCFENASRHLRDGGALVVECVVPRHRGGVFLRADDRVSFEDVDPTTGTSWSHHHWFRERHVAFSGRYRDVHPAELDLMARIAGMERVERWGWWDRRPFTADSESHVSVWRKA